MKVIITLSLWAVLSALPAWSGSALAADPEVIIRTSHGDVTLRLYADAAPLSVANFLEYVDSGFYAGTIFHRVIPRFMIQGGGLTPKMKEKPRREPVKNEALNRLHNERGTIAMARTNDPDSATNQFYINVRTNFTLDWSPSNPGYTVFGEVIDGMAVVDSIAMVQTGVNKGRQDVPLEPVLINEVVRAPAP
jgi:cyclophilin family peptidyl-prolyl cis-trans isomerase